MKFVFTKVIQDKEIGHLYEHIFSDHLTNCARAGHLFSYLDYFLDAKYYHEGYVLIQIETYTPQAAHFFKNLDKFHPELDKDAINGALLQIMAEMSVDIAMLDESEIQKALTICQSNPWQPQIPNELNSHHASSKPTIVYKPLNKDAFGVICQSITLNVPEKDPTKRSQLLVLFLIVSKAIRSNLQEEITRSSFCFTYEDRFEYSRSSKKARDINLYRIDKRQATSITDENEVAQRLLKSMKRFDFADRLAVSIQRAQKEDNEYPDEEEVLAKLNIALCPGELKSILNASDIKQLLDKVHIEFTYC